MPVPMLVGNWKMNKLNGDLDAFFAACAAELAPRLTARVDVLFAVPYLLLERAVRLASPLGIRIAAQNVHWEAAGAYTGEISAGMLQEAGVNATLIGHSERRQYFGEDDASVAKKTRAALGAGMLSIVCVGETLAEREQGLTEAVVTRQVRSVLAAVDHLDNLVLAYEPVWAIGTGRSATSAQAQDVHALIRRLVGDGFGRDSAAALRVLYGGSAAPANIADLISQSDVNGGLVGGASLKAGDFCQMAKVVAEA